MFKDKTLLITGGTGSFGSTILEKFKNIDIRSQITYNKSTYEIIYYIKIGVIE